jgi:hypothetical protein
MIEGGRSFAQTTNPTTELKLASNQAVEQKAD